jgi:hypothetical protein
MSWYETNVPKKVALEFATLAKQSFNSANLAASLGRFRECAELKDLARVNGEREYGLDGKLYVRCRRDPLSYLKVREAGGVPPTYKLQVKEASRPPVVPRFDLVKHGALGDIEGGHVLKEFSGLLREELLAAGFQAVEAQDDSVVAVFLPPQSYLQFIAEADCYTPTCDYPMLSHGVMGELWGAAVILSHEFDKPVVAGNATTVVVNSD